MNEKMREAVALLEEAGFAYSVHEGWAEGVVVKTIVFKKKVSGEPFAVAVRKEDRVSYKKIRSLVGSGVSPLSPEELEELGWVPGECCPLTINCSLYVDTQAVAPNEIHTGSGDTRFGLLYCTQALHAIRDDLSVVDARE